MLQGADDLADITSVADLLLNVAGASAYASIEFNKYSTDERDNSRFHPSTTSTSVGRRMYILETLCL